MTGSRLARMSLANLHHDTTSAEGDLLCTWRDESGGDGFGVTWMVATYTRLSGPRRT